MVMARFDLTTVLAQHTDSDNTQRAYYRWIDRYLVDVAEVLPTKGEARVHRMSSLGTTTLKRAITVLKLTAWLAKLAEAQHSRQALDQARAAIVTLAVLLGEAEIFERGLVRALQKVSVPPVEKKTTPERLLTPTELKTLIQAVSDIATTENQKFRNEVVGSFLVHLALRREELSALRWGDIVLREGKPVLRIEDTSLELSRKMLTAIDRWRGCFVGNLQDPPAESPLIRRIWKGGRIAKDGLSPDGIWLIIHEAAEASQLGTVTPDDLRRSVIANMYREGASVQEINRLLRHRTVLITERFLAKLAKPSDE
jgi:integrase